MLEGAVDAVEFRRARGFGGPFVVHGCDYDRDCVQESESGLEISCGGGIGFGEYLEGTKAELAGMERRQREGAEFENGLTASR